jgi:hypothetical protein
LYTLFFNPLKNESHLNNVGPSQKTYSISITKSSQFTIFREIMGLHTERHEKYCGDKTQGL